MLYERDEPPEEEDREDGIAYVGEAGKDVCLEKGYVFTN